MPSLLTHHLFGQKVLHAQGWAYSPGSGAQDAFVLGCQGPDPFFFALGLRHPSGYIRFARALHTVRSTEAIEAMCRYTARRQGKERAVLDAYLAGYLCHYALDSTAHPYVYAVQKRECAALGMKKDRAHIHMKLETAIDSMLTGIYENPSRLLPRNRDACFIIGRMYRAVARSVYGLPLPESCFWMALRRMVSMERLFKSHWGIKRAALSAAERFFCRYSFFEALSHSRDTKGISDPLNRAHREWTAPADGSLHSESFSELFRQGMEKAGAIILKYRAGAPASELTGGIQFNGGPERPRAGKKTHRHKQTKGANTQWNNR